MDVLPDALEQLTARLEALERRVLTLEAVEQSSAAPATPAFAVAPIAAERTSHALGGGFFPVLSKALMGIAGAYFLRAVAESGVLPRPLIAAIAIVYALLWLVAAARIPAEAWFASTVYAATSAMILVPMLWELTLSFKVLSAPGAAAILGVFAIAATALAWKQDRSPVYWVVNATAAVAALALSVATQDLLPFLATILLMALIAEIAAGREHHRSLRLLAAAAADLAVWALIFIYASPQSTRQEYPLLDAVRLILPGCLLFLIYAVSIVTRCAKQGRKISIFETSQAIAAFLLAASSVLFFAPNRGAIILGALCLLISLGSYTVAFLLFGKDAEARNFHIFSLWAASLLLVGSNLILPSDWLPVGLSLAAIAASLPILRPAINMQGLAFLLAAAFTSGLFHFISDALAGSLSAGISWNIFLVSACMIVCYAMSVSGSRMSKARQWINQITSALATGESLALLVTGLMRLITPFLAREAHPVALMRTIVLCMGALALAWISSAWRRIELTRLAYAMLGVIAMKLLLQDLPLGNLGSISASIFMLAIALIAVPRLAHRKERA